MRIFVRPIYKSCKVIQETNQFDDKGNFITVVQKTLFEGTITECKAFIDLYEAGKVEWYAKKN